MLVGAQAVYVHTGDADFVATAPHTTDADFCVASADLNDTPLLADLLIPCGFSLEEQPGDWRSRDGIRVDLMVPEALSKLAPLFGSPDAKGIGMAIRAAGPSDEADVISASFIALVSDLLAARRW